jgi:hypothetical protein
MFMIFAEHGLEKLTLFVFCFEIEGSGLRFAAFTIPPVQTVGVTAVGGLVHERRQ